MAYQGEQVTQVPAGENLQAAQAVTIAQPLHLHLYRTKKNLLIQTLVKTLQEKRLR